MRIGYIRVSTDEQNTARQDSKLESMTDRIFSEKISGKDANRPELKAMLDFVREGDTVIVDSISRLARSTRDLLSIVETLTSKGVNLVSLKENFDTTTPSGKFTLTIFGALAELERETILERQREGIEEAKKRGVYKGRKPIDIDSKNWDKVYGEWKEGNITAVEAQRRLGLTASTFYRRVREAEKA